MPTTTIPIVAITADPVVAGLVPSLARPGGNITGVSTDAGLELHGKRLGLLAEAIPKLSNARYLGSQPSWTGPFGAVVREVARRAGISLAGALLGSPINEAEHQREGGVCTMCAPFVSNTKRSEIAAFGNIYFVCRRCGISRTEGCLYS
jgi:putative ABC transport system substrate-binding protein